MTDCYKTQKEVLINYQKEIEEYKKLKEKIKQEIKRQRTLEQTTKDESYKLAHSMTADYLEELEV